MKSLTIGGNSIERKDCVKCLGIYIDENLTWAKHINFCKAKISSSIYAIKRIKNIVPNTYLRTLYYTLIQPFLTYGITIWGATYITHRNKLFLLQKRVIRIISGSKYNDHTTPIFKNLKILKLDDIYKVQIARIIFQFKQNTLPHPIQMLFRLNRNLHNKVTRQNDDLNVKKFRTTLATQSIIYTGPKIWNALPSNIKSLTIGTTKRFAAILNHHLIQEYNT